MPSLTFPFSSEGFLVVDVIVRPAGQLLASRLTGYPGPLHLWGKGTIDTGANASAVSNDFLRQLGIPILRSTTTQSFAGSHPVDLYEVSLGISDISSAAKPLFTPPELTVSGMDLEGIDVLIGTDVLVHCKLLIDGPARTFTLDF